MRRLDCLHGYCADFKFIFVQSPSNLTMAVPKSKPVAVLGEGEGEREQPGWRIEQKYSPGVLIGNWSEDRLGKVLHHLTRYMAITASLCLSYVSPSVS